MFSIKQLNWIVTALVLTASSRSLGFDSKSKAFYEPNIPRHELATRAKGHNLFTQAKATASGQWSDFSPDRAIDGDVSLASHWACEGMPCWLQLELPHPKPLAAIYITPYWQDRYYQFKIEGSLDGTAWTMLTDATSNTTSFGPTGKLYQFSPVNLQFVRVTFSKSSAGNRSGGHIVEIEGYSTDDPILEASPSSWQTVHPGFHGAVGSIDHRYHKWNVPPLNSSGRTLKLAGWKGERVFGQFVVWSAQAMKQLRFNASRIADTNPTVNFLRYVYASHRVPRVGLYADMLDTAGEIDCAAKTARPIWYSIDIPQTAKPGTYHGTLTVRAAGMAPVEFNIELEVQNMALPSPTAWGFHLDLWQHPWAFARVHRVEPFSKEFYTLYRPLLERLGDAGQKCLTTTINRRSWNQQTYDAYESMIQWIKQPDGSWKYDYTLFDQWVAFGESCGIASQINCYSMIPWGYTYYYVDGKTGDRQSIKAKPGSKEFEALWRPFLKDFAGHLRKTGRFEKATIAMDERHLEDLVEVTNLVQSIAPGMKIALAANRNLESIAPKTYDYCFAIFTANNIGRDFTDARRAKGQKTTFYVCTGPERPNTFVYSPLAESNWMGWFAYAHGFDGFLRWAYAHWGENPLQSVDHGPWQAGDTMFVYPGNRSSIRFERLRDGIEDYEKLRIILAQLERQGNTSAIREFENIFKHFDYSHLPHPEQITSDVNLGRMLLHKYSRQSVK